MTNPASARSLPSPTVCAFGLWVLLTLVFASQLFWSGHAQNWFTALWQEGLYWLIWAALCPVCFRVAKRMRAAGLVATRYFGGAAALALAASIAHSALVVGFYFAKSVWSGSPPSANYPLQRLGLDIFGANLAVSASILLAWHAALYWRELRDRQVRSAELESNLREAQLQALRSQLNPHFLFNTLHSIAELTHENPALAERLILRLGDLLRKALEISDRQELPLSAELEFVKAYVEIEQMRLGERLQVTWEIAPEALMKNVPSLILQPIVENAIKHGRSADGAVRVEIRAGVTPQGLGLEVRDRGPGLPKNDERREGIGLSNSRRRLMRLYGEGGHIEFVNDAGLIVRIRTGTK